MQPLPVDMVGLAIDAADGTVQAWAKRGITQLAAVEFPAKLHNADVGCSRHRLTRPAAAITLTYDPRPATLPRAELDVRVSTSALVQAAQDDFTVANGLRRQRAVQGSLSAIVRLMRASLGVRVNGVEPILIFASLENCFYSTS